MKVMHCLSLLVVALGLASCSGGKYADVKAAMNEQVSAMDDFVAKIDKAAGGKEIATAVSRYSEQTARMMEQGKKLKEKYSDTDFENVPELKEASAKLQQTAMKFGQAFMKISTQYGSDPDVQAALAKWQEAMSRASRP